MSFSFGNFAFGFDFSFIFYVLLTLVVLAIVKSNAKKKSRTKLSCINEEYEKTAAAARRVIIQRELGRAAAKLHDRLKIKDERKKSKRVFVLDFNGGIPASEVDTLRQEITSIIAIASNGDEVIVKVESPGGTVNGYGLAAAQLQRIKKAGLKLTVLVDKVAASGGYMMACVADKIVASPFSYIGSVGVVAEFPNFSRVLKKFGIDYKTYTAGESKRTVTSFGEITKDGEKRFKDRLVKIHDLFKAHVKQYRPKVNIKKVATGEHWTAAEALDIGLVDAIQTSDDYIIGKLDSANVYRVEFEKKKEDKKLSLALVDRAVNAVFDRIEKYLVERNNIQF